MPPVTQKFICSLNNKGWASCIISLLVLASPTWAGYIPPSQPSAPGGGSTTTTGRRGGCLGNEPTTLTTLAPASHVGQTISTHPTFAWYVPNTHNVPIEFHLFTTNGELLYQTQLESSPGLMSLALPESQPALQTGERYRWQVTLLCNPNRPSSAIVARAEIEVVALTQPLEASLRSAPDPTRRAEQLAEVGLWYDAFAAVVDPDNASLQTARRALLTNLAEVEETRGQSDRSIQLRYIADTVE